MENKKLTQQELDNVLAEHRKWVCSVAWPREGTRAVLTGADLTDAVLTDAVLTRADLTGADLTRADLTGADLTDADLTRADLTDAVLTGADLTGAVLTRAVLTRAVLTRAVLTLDAVPSVARLDSQILEHVTAVPESFDMSTWHGDVDGLAPQVIAGKTCGTTHCRAGWAIHLAGEPGYALEKMVGPQTAGWLIYLKSTGRIPDFHTDDDDALEDIRACAAKEAAEVAP